MYTLIHRLSHKIIARFDTLEDAIRALQDAAVPELFEVTNNR
jgi:hypothetical protein